MKNCLLLGALLMGFTGATVAQSVTVYVPNGYKMVVIPDSIGVPQVVSAATAPQTVCATPTSAPTYRPHPYVRHLVNIGEGAVTKHQINDHHH